VAREEKKALAAWYAKRLESIYHDPKIPLDFETPLDLYVATVLSAQCTDARVNLVTPPLFARCRRPEDYLALGSANLERLIQSTGFFRNKTKSILGACARMVEAYGGRLPETMEELVKLPGVGRKTANVILSGAFGMNEGIAVDTHVIRVAGRLGLTRYTAPDKIEQDLLPLVPRKKWSNFGLALILHGRRICMARNPKCEICPLDEKCPYGRKVLSRGPAKVRPRPSPESPKRQPRAQRQSRPPESSS
jgi:endonuclease III